MPAFQYTGAQCAKQTGVQCFLRQKGDIVIHVEHDVLIPRIQHVLQVLFSTFSEHTHTPLGSHSAHGVIDVVCDGLDALAGQLAAHLADTTNQVLKTCF